MADVTSRADRAKGMGLIGAAFGLGFVTGPAIGGIFSLVNPLDHFPLLASLGVNPFSGAATVAFLLACLNLFWIWRRFAESLRPEKRSTASIASRNPIALLLARHEPPVRRTNHVYFLFIFAFAGMEFTLSFLAVSRFDFSTVQITGMMVYVGLILIITQGLIVRRAAPKVGERRMAITGLALVMTAFVILGLAPSPTLLYVGLTVMGLGSGLTTPSLTALVSLYTDTGRQGQVLGTFRSLGSLGRATGPIIASFVFWWFGSNWSYLLGAALLIPSFLTALRLTEPSKSEDGS